MTWRNIKDDPPPMDGQGILAWCAGWNCHIVMWCDNGAWYTPVEISGRMHCPQPTHWMPLPPPPATET